MDVSEEFIHKNYIERDFSEFVPNEYETSERDLQCSKRTTDWSNTEVFEQTIYPVLTKTNQSKIQTGKMPYEVPTAPPASNWAEMYKDAKQAEAQSKINEFLSERKKLDELLAHYTKIKNRWTRADSTIKITGITLGFLLTCCSICIAPISTLGFGTVLIVTSSVAGGISALDLFLTETISIGLTSKKKKIYREICQCLELGINKLYLYQIKALSDNNLTNDEIETSKKIIEEIRRSCEALKIKAYKVNGKAQSTKSVAANAAYEMMGKHKVLRSVKSNETLRLKAEAKKEILNELKRL